MKDRSLHNYEKLHYKGESIDDSEDQLLYELTGKSCSIKPDVSCAWQKIQPVLEKGKSTSFLSSNWLKIAASFLIVSIVSIYLLWEPQTSIQYVTEQTGSQVKNIMLPDGSSILLNANSAISYNKSFTEQRILQLEGEAFFDVTKNEVPFQILTESGTVTVLGTSFNVKDGKNNLRVQVVSGKVQLSSQKEVVVLNPGNEGWINKNTYRIYTDPSADINKLVWKTKTFQFDDHALQEAISMLEDYYKVEIEIKDENLKNCTITGTFVDQSLKQILASFESVLNIKIKYKSDIIVLKGKGC